MRKTGPGANISYIYSPDGTLLGETSNAESTLTTQYVYLEGQPIALIRNNLLYFIHTDHLGRGIRGITVTAYLIDFSNSEN